MPDAVQGDGGQKIDKNTGSSQRSRHGGTPGEKAR
jgi:hypothetical protein